MIDVDNVYNRICKANASKYGFTPEEAMKCDEVRNPICLECPFITK